MFGLSLVFISSIFNELGSSIGKHEVELKKESIYSLGFFGLLWGTVFFFAYALTTSNAFVFSPASLPTFSARVIFEILQAYTIVHAISLADRSTFGFLRILTIPLLLITDMFLGYTISFWQTVGISIIVVSFIILFVNHGIRSKGAGFVVATAIIAVITISLYKYDITNFNSVPAEQGMISIILMIFYFFMVRFYSGENPLRLLKNPTIFMQSLSDGVGQVFMSFAYLFAPASVITTANRSFNVIASVISGDLYFKEKHIVLKLVVFFVMAIGIIMLTF